MKKDNLVLIGMILNHNIETCLVEELHKRLIHEHKRILEYLELTLT